MTKIVAFIGRRQSGKDTAAAALVTHGYELVKFADGLKIMLRALLEYQGLLPKTIDMVLDGHLKETQIKELSWQTARRAMQTLGTEWGRHIMGEDIWVRATMNRCENFPKVVISDCRYPNEAQAVRAAGGTLIKIKRPKLVNAHEVDTHSSEAEIDALQGHYELSNNGTIQHLQDKVQEIIL